MTKSEFAAAVTIAKSDKDLSATDDSVLFGCGLPGFQPVHVTLDMVAKFVRWQALQMNGAFDAAALNECAHIARRRFVVIA